ncbi:MAG: CDP-alcohol phosphatidyltransferase family protein [Ignavibacteriales bacterium]|nr:CDP-alcohol phosphatidyltransferase family protein [Ignavibacteriales bacterium]
MNPQVSKNIHVFEQPADRGINHKRTVIFKQLRALRWPDMLTLLGLLCVSFSVYFSFKGFLGIAYVLILLQFLLDYFDGKLARAIGGGVLGVYLDSFTDFMAVAASVVFGWFVGITGTAMLIAGFLNDGAASIRLAYFTSYKQKGFTGIPTVLAASAVSTIAFLGYFFVQEYLVWFVIFYFISAIAMISDLRLKKI